MGLDYQRLEQLLAEAAGRSDPAERTAFLDQACAGDRELRTELEHLLAAAGNVGDFLEAPAFPPGDRSDAAGMPWDEDLGLEGAGATIGRYTLREELGQGAFGDVYLARQLEPVRREVALKIVKPGMDTREVVARFEAERLQLFIQVCHAVQHAHQKGIIHRDLKPTNILVTLIDGAPVPKVIDFGIAKALGQKLTEKTLVTGLLKIVGTPAYMSPEQAGLSGLDIDTRADIYALGVLLYELLTGVTPFDSETLRHAALDDVLRMIRETEPPKPSTRVGTLGEKLTVVAEKRRSEPGALGRLFRGDLDWIVMKCLEKNRRRRYETASSLAADIERHLNHEPVTAAAPSTLYRFRKYVQRQRKPKPNGSGNWRKPTSRRPKWRLPGAARLPSS